MSRLPAPRTRVPYRRSYRPSASECERAIIDHWYSLCDAQRRDDKTGVGIFTTNLHDMGVFLFRARKRESMEVRA